MEQARYRIDVFSTVDDNRGRVVAKQLSTLGYPVTEVRTSDVYLINADIPEAWLSLAGKALINRVSQTFTVNAPYSVGTGFSWVLQVGFLPGVTDNIAHTAREVFEDLLKIKLDEEKSVFTAVCYYIKGDLSRADVLRAANELHNPLIQCAQLLSFDEYEKHGMNRVIPVVHLSGQPSSDEVNLDIANDELVKLGKEGVPGCDGLRRGPLALDLQSMKVIQKYFKDIEKRNPTDIELESIAQTWSEHCKHTIFSAKLDDNEEGVFKKYIRAATERVRREKGGSDFCRSVFTDNAGGIDFDDDYIIADKVETHNSPSALDPFGGSITGIVGVNRDAMGFGMGAKPVANRFGFCFADPNDHEPLYRGKTEDTKLLSPRRIMDGVIRGVNVGGNCSGIPTPQGFVYFDKRYKGKPLVFVGTIGLIPKKVNGVSSVKKCAQDGDLVVVAGGRVGKDGIHGATFSSEALSSGSPATAVQIGDPITQKKLSDAIVKEARDLGLYSSITDNGAGGISCSVAEMAKESGGFEVDLDKVPLKYHGLSPWEIWVSESQERMTLAVPEENISQFINLMEKRGAEAVVIGKFTKSGRGIVRYNGKEVFNMTLDFLHNGLPRKELTAKLSIPARKENLPSVDKNLSDAFLAMSARLNIASFSFISSQYDHEVQGGSVIKPLQGKGKVNGNVSVICPVLTSKRGVVLSQGLYPSYSEINPYNMAASSIDTAVRNAISAGGSLDHMAILDNFCWCDPLNPERLGQLRAAAEACYDYAVAYGTPFVSGKDSMFNDFRGFDAKGNPVMLSVPPTLLISSFGVIKDAAVCQTMDFKFADDLLYIMGDTNNEWAGSEYEAYLNDKGLSSEGEHVPSVDAVKNAKLYRAYTAALEKHLIASSVSVERGGLAVALMRSALAGVFGAKIDLAKVSSIRSDIALFSESQGRFLVSVDPKKKDAFESHFKGCAYSLIGSVTKETKIEISGNEGYHAAVTVDELNESYRKTFRGF
jgi:phosphoribosylformylglycinamidine synthase subunit PurSL